MIIVILHRQERTEIDHRGKVIAEAGSVWVSHGIDLETGKTVILPEERWENFRRHCNLYEGEWYLR